MENVTYRPTFAEVDLSAMRDNTAAVRRAVGPLIKILPAVKANGYGHGAVQTARACLAGGADGFCVATVEEAVELREAGFSQLLLVLGCSPPQAAQEIVSRDLSATVCDLRFAHALSNAAQSLGRQVRVHIKVDTGMGRIGISPEIAAGFVSEVASLPGALVEGVYTHFSSADDQDQDFTITQIARFVDAVDSIRGRGLNPQMVHASNSPGIVAFPQADFDAVRPGIILYGAHPIEDAGAQPARDIRVRGALTLKTRIAFLKRCKAGEPISYGRTCTTTRGSVIATIPIGYADGYSRMLSNKGQACVRGVRVPVVGRVCMDQVMLDVTDVPGVTVGDEVILLGGGVDYLATNRLAELIGTVAQDVTCAISSRVPRVYKGLEDDGD
jgi:alanine racemase